MIDALGYFIYNVFVFIWPMMLLYFLARLSWFLWNHYSEQSSISSINWVLLEIMPPREVLRSPRAMELFFTNALFHSKVWFSLEIASIDGQVRFYVRTPNKLKEFLETNMYAQYPQAQIKVVDDYTFSVDKISEESDWNLWGCEFVLEKDNAYPIKTYVDFDLDKNLKEEQKIDPISPVIEFLGSLQKGEQLWLQIVLRPSKDKWIDDSKKTLESIMEPYAEKKAPDFLSTLAEGITNKTMKLGFEVGIRVCYVAKKEFWRNGVIKNIGLLFKQYSNPFLNSFKTVNTTEIDSSLPFAGKSILGLKNRMLNEYRHRELFSPPLREKIPIFWPISIFIPTWIHSNPFILNVEEIATLFHFPGQILKVPTLERVESKEAAPPTNLPI
jgi:hypothetical protein